MKAPVYIVEILGDVIAKVITETGFSINYVYGLNIDILANLKIKDDNPTQKDLKYPLIAVYTPILERRGSGIYADATFNKIVIATLTDKDDLNPDRMTKTFKPILYPTYISFLKNLCRHKNVSVLDPDTIIHTKYDFMGKQQVAGVNDYIDSIQLEGLKIPIIQTKTC